ncbi:MAG TPA: glycine cleavage T C-terminal barrel domain-containing protein, partial [Candidatus Sulfotelmatobacter sp.]|nr:glycine cleavage T C-terminal barrel domain-containing protein [Candidatus Sulfotelmatobacter sp.]
HESLGARLATVNHAEVVASYGDVPAEYSALRAAAGVLDLSCRSRLCLAGSDRVRFLHGQVTNNAKELRPGEGCYAALVTAKGKLQSDLNVYCLPEELLLDFEPGLTAAVSQRLERYIVADDVQVVDVEPLYGLLTVQGPQAGAVVRGIGLFSEFPSRPFASVRVTDPTLGEIYLMNQPRIGTSGFDLFLPGNALGAVADKLIAAAKAVGGRACGWDAVEIARIEAGIPRFGADMDETNFPQECGIESRAVSYTKGCYIGQEVLNRLHTGGHVNRQLCGLRWAEALPGLPSKGDKLLRDGKEVGYITSAVISPALNAPIALGYVRRQAAAVGAELRCRSAQGESLAQIVNLPFVAL